jgi:hypothetical protein
MKKSSRLFTLLIVSAIFLSGAAFAGGKPFEGVITYKITYPDSKFTEAQLAMFPKVLTVAIKGTKSRTEIGTGMGNQVSITDYEAKTKIALIDMMGQKYALKSTSEDIEKENSKSPKATVEITAETKVIAGYNCKKAVVTSDDDGVKTTYDVYFTNELGGKGTNFDNPLYKDIDGVLMEFSMKTPQISMVFSATGVEKKTVSSKEFDIPAEYKLTTEEELKSKFGGMDR